MSALDNALQALLKMLRKELVWENASPKSSFNEQTINIPKITPNTPVIIETISKAESTWYESTTNVFFPENLGEEDVRYVLTFGAFISSNTVESRGVSAKRGFSINDGNITFRYATKTIIGGNVSTANANNVLVPYRIYTLDAPSIS